MTEQERIEGINSEQLATATDRLLLAARFGRARPSSSQLYARGSSPHLNARGSAPRIQPNVRAVPQGDAPLFARGSAPHIQPNGRYVPQSDAPLYARPHIEPLYAPHIDAPSPRKSTPHIQPTDLYVPQSDAPLYAPQVPARGSSPHLHDGATSRHNDEHTVLTRCPRHHAAWRTFATISLLTSLFSVATAIVLLF